MTRPLSSVLKSTDLVRNAFERYRMPVKIMAKEKTAKFHDLKSIKTSQVKGNPLSDLSKPYFYHYKKPIKKKFVKEEADVKIEECMNKVIFLEQKSPIDLENSKKDAIKEEINMFQNDKDNSRFKDIQRAQTKVLVERRKGYVPVMKYGQILRDSLQSKIYSTEDNVPEFSSSDDDVDYENLTPRSYDIFQVTKEIKKSFKEFEQPPQTKISFYKIGKVLGKGAFGKVNLALHILGRKLVAIKSIK